MIVELHRLNSWLVSAVGFGLNGLVLWLILRHTPLEMRIYGRILMQTAVNDLLMLTAQALAQPLFFVDNGISTALLLGPLGQDTLPHLWELLILELWILFAIVAFVQFGVQFVYRYIVLTRFYAPSTGAYLLALGGPPLVFALLHPFTVDLFVPPELAMLRNPEINDILGWSITVNASSAVSGTGAEIGPNFAFRTKNASNKLWESVVFLEIFASYVLVIVFGWKARRVVCRSLLISGSESTLTREEEKGSVGGGRQRKRSRALHRQMNRNLTIQAILPLFGLLPALAIMPQMVAQPQLGGGSSSGRRLTEWTMAAIWPYYWLPALNPLVTILTVTQFRTKVWALLVPPKRGGPSADGSSQQQSFSVARFTYKQFSQASSA